MGASAGDKGVDIVGNIVGLTGTLNRVGVDSVGDLEDPPVGKKDGAADGEPNEGLFVGG